MNDSLDDNTLAILVGARIRPACVYYTSHTMLNPSTHFKYANSAQVNSCSSPNRISVTPHLHCEYPVNQNSCGIYSPDYSLLKKSATDKSSVYYLSRYRMHNSSYSYLIYDNNQNIYNRFDYTDLSLLDNSIDEEVFILYYNFLDQLLIKYSDQEVVLNTPKPTSKSFLKTLVSN